MFTADEQPLLSGDDGEVDEFVDADRCMVVDWRGTEEEVLEDLDRFLPDGAFTHETTFPGNETASVRMRFRGREDAVTLPFKPQNNFRILLRAWRLLQPDYDIKIFRCTDSSDTQAFLVRPAEWWSAYRVKYPQQYQKIFRDVIDLVELWGLEPPEGSGPGKPWWKFW